MMVAAKHRITGRRSRSLAQLERDAALDRLGRARRWLFVGAAAGTAGLAAAASAAVPGHSLHSRAGAAGAAGARAAAPTPSSGQMPPAAGPGDLGLQGPAQEPQSSPPAPQPQAAPTPVSGGS
jgi:hypothetical protein